MDIQFADGLLDAAEAMIKNASNEVGRDRKRLNFANTVRESFSFLADYGFEMFDALPTLVRYRKGELEAHVYHGRRSFEVSFEIVLRDERYAISELIRATNPEEAGRYRNYTATTPEGVIKAVSQLKELVKQYGELALQGDAEYFARLEGLRRAWMESYALEVLAGQLRPKADAAFNSGDYRQAAELYEKIRANLSPVELKKLALAKERGRS